MALSREEEEEEGRVTDVGASPRGCPVFRVGADRRVCPDDSAGAAARRTGLLRIAREAAREREAGATARTILDRHKASPYDGNNRAQTPPLHQQGRHKASPYVKHYTLNSKQVWHRISTGQSCSKY